MSLTPLALQWDERWEKPPRRRERKNKLNSGFEERRMKNECDADPYIALAPLATGPEPMGLAVSSDGKRLAAASQSKLAVYEITTSK